MSKSIYKLRKGLAYIIITGEPVFIKSLNDETAEVVRPRISSDGMMYVHERFALEELESPQTRARRELKFEDFLRLLRDKQDSKRYSLTPLQEKQLASAMSKKGNLVSIEGLDS